MPCRRLLRRFVGVMPIVSRVWVWFTKYVRATPGKLRKVGAWFKKLENTGKIILRCIVVIFILLLLSAILAMLVIMLQVILCPDVTSALMKLTDIYAKPELLKFIGLGVSGLIATLGVVGLLLRAKALDAQSKLAEKGHIQDRFKTATDHLGSQHASVRIAAFYEFCHLVEIKPALRKNIFDILCGHLRHSTENKDCQAKEGEENPDNGKVIKPSAEMHDLLDILFKPGNKDERIFDGLTANLRGAYIRGASLQGIYLKNAKMQRAKLQYVKLEDAELQDARMWRTNLQNANLRRANLQRVYLRHSNLQDAKLQGANLQGANLYYVNLQGANLQKANLQGAKLQEANLQGANLQDADLQGAKINKNTTMPNDWKDMVIQDNDSKTGVLLVDDEENTIENY